MHENIRYYAYKYKFPSTGAKPLGPVTVAAATYTHYVGKLPIGAALAEASPRIPCDKC